MFYIYIYSTSTVTMTVNNIHFGEEFEIAATFVDYLALIILHIKCLVIPMHKNQGS